MDPGRRGATHRRVTAAISCALRAGGALLVFVVSFGTCGRSDVPGRRPDTVVSADTGDAERTGTDALGSRTGAVDTASGSAARRGAYPRQPRPERRADTLRLEGMPQPLESHLYRAPWREPLAFSTYVPADMITEAAGDTVRFVADFGGQRQDSALVQVVALPHGLAPDSLRRATRRLAEQRGLPAGPTSANLPWAIAEFDFRGRACSPATCSTGTIVLAAHGGRFFRVLWQYPAEYGDGMAPRVRWILEEWRWQDTGDGLSP